MGLDVDGELVLKISHKAFFSRRRRGLGSKPTSQAGKFFTVLQAVDFLGKCE